MKKLLGAATAIVLVGGMPAFAGGLAEAVMEPEAVEAATSSSSGGVVVAILLLLLIAVAASGGGSPVPPK